MGDKRVIAAAERNVLHRADTGAMKFQIKVPLPGLGPALTFTAKSKPFLELYKIVIGRQTKVVNMLQEEHTVTSFPLGNVDLQNFQEFWVTWYNRKIRMGIGTVQKPFLVFAMDPEYDIGYVQFNTMSPHWAPIEWIIETSPVVFKPLPCKNFDDGLQWVPMRNGKLPPNAMIGGFEVGPVYIARAYHHTSLCPGKYVPATGFAYVPWGHREYIKDEFEILCGYNAKWIKTKFNYIPTNAFVGGESEVENEPLYIGRGIIDGKLIPGKVHVRYKTCFLPYEGKEIEMVDYEILVIPEKNAPQAVDFEVNR